MESQKRKKTREKAFVRIEQKIACDLAFLYLLFSVHLLLVAVFVAVML